MSWHVVLRPEVATDIEEAADWYDEQQDGLGSELCEEILRVLDRLSENPLLNSRRHPVKDIRWRYSERFPYRVIYQVVENENTVVVVAVLHGARHDRHWKRRIQ
jgi:plasmid stabilization system protein ParE